MICIFAYTLDRFYFVKFIFKKIHVINNRLLVTRVLLNSINLQPLKMMKKFQAVRGILLL